MDNRRSPARNSRDIYSSSARPVRSGNRRRADYDTAEIDIYNRVGRDISSSSNGKTRSTSRRRKKKKSGCLGKLLAVVFSLILIVALGGLAYAGIMFSRLNRSDDADSAQLAQYVQQPSAAPSWQVKSDSSVTNILLIGVDKNDDGTDGRSDTNMLLSVNNNQKALHLVSFLRDTYLEIPTVGKNKLNAAFPNGGAALTMQTLENNYRVNIDKYVSVDFDSFSKIIDKMGGLDINMSKDACQAENENMGSRLKPGVNHLNGRLCLYYARIRAIDDDFGRTGRQREVVELMIKKFKTMNPIEANKILYDYLPYVKTNLSDSELVSLASIAASVSNYKMATMHVPNNNTYKNEVINGVGDVLTPDLEKNGSLLRQFLYGDTGAGT